jgi:hypothetical protein
MHEYTIKQPTLSQERFATLELVEQKFGSIETYLDLSKGITVDIAQMEQLTREMTEAECKRTY